MTYDLLPVVTGRVNRGTCKALASGFASATVPHFASFFRCTSDHILTTYPLELHHRYSSNIVVIYISTIFPMKNAIGSGHPYRNQHTLCKPTIIFTFQAASAASAYPGARAETRGGGTWWNFGADTEADGINGFNRMEHVGALMSFHKCRFRVEACDIL